MHSLRLPFDPPLLPGYPTQLTVCDVTILPINIPKSKRRWQTDVDLTLDGPCLLALATQQLCVEVRPALHGI